MKKTDSEKKTDLNSSAGNPINSPVRIVEYRPELQTFFEKLNRYWIERYFRMEAHDYELLQDPQKHIIDRGGAVLFAELDGRITGTVALKRYDEKLFELAKMAVDGTFQGRGIGEKLGQAALEKAWQLGAEKVVLYSNTALQSALRLYARLGFVEVPLENQVFVRSNIKMEITFEKSRSRSSGG